MEEYGCNKIVIKPCYFTIVTLQKFVSNVKSSISFYVMVLIEKIFTR